MDILQRITDLRDERGWSKNHLAKMSGLSQSTVSNLYNREYEPSFSTLESICKGFGISLAEFFNTGESTMLTVEQKTLLLEWSKLPDDKKAMILELIKKM
ncbi:helix-turn-helix transcriptional regulator [Tyzzerella sp. OttesenSCG-928-J15]|nr:helix-turn-helix transcriptional regulator [Tyzzerella sp. OttesenSCG-928-J15]